MFSQQEPSKKIAAKQKSYFLHIENEGRRKLTM